MKTKGYKLDFKQVRQAAYGRWPEIMDQLAEISDAIDRGNRKSGPCPVHGGTDGFRVFKDFKETGGMVCNTCGAKSNGFEALAWLNDTNIKRAYYDVGKVLGMLEERDAQAEAAQKKRAARLRQQMLDAKRYREEQEQKQAVRNLDRIRTIWKDALHFNHADAAPLRRYIRMRGLPSAVASKALRFVPEMDYFAPDPKNPKKMIKQGRYPTMVALLLGPDRDVFAMHRTYLDINGNKAPVDDPKKFSGTTKVGPTTGGAIHLYPAEHVVALAEGIETSWAVHEATGLPVWATGNANNLEHIELPKEIEHVFIFADLDRSGRGLEAAQAAGEKLIGEGRQVQIHTPIGPIPADAKGIDWLDVYNTHGHQVFPNIRINGQPWSMYEKKQKRPERTLKAV